MSVNIDVWNKISESCKLFDKNLETKEIVVGSRVMVNDYANEILYIVNRKYIKIDPGMEGRVVRFSSTKKIGVEFDKEIFMNYDEKKSSLDCGCHGFGKLHHCIYLPITCLTVLHDEELLLLTQI
mgnify:CR=1 FL=1